MESASYAAYVSTFLFALHKYSFRDLNRLKGVGLCGVCGSLMLFSGKGASLNAHTPAQFAYQATSVLAGLQTELGLRLVLELVGVQLAEVTPVAPTNRGQVRREVVPAVLERAEVGEGGVPLGDGAVALVLENREERVGSAGRREDGGAVGVDVGVAVGDLLHPVHASRLHVVVRQGVDRIEQRLHAAREGRQLGRLGRQVAVRVAEVVLELQRAAVLHRGGPVGDHGHGREPGVDLLDGQAAQREHHVGEVGDELVHREPGDAARLLQLGLGRVAQRVRGGRDGRRGGGGAGTEGSDGRADERPRGGEGGDLRHLQDVAGLVEQALLDDVGDVGVVVEPLRAGEDATGGELEAVGGGVLVGTGCLEDVHLGFLLYFSGAFSRAVLGVYHHDVLHFNG